MNDFKVLLYSDGSHQAFSAAVYTATLLKNMPNMRLTVVQVHEHDEVAKDTEYSWINTWPVSPTSEWMKHVLDDSDTETTNEYHKILTKTNEIFSKNARNVAHQDLYANAEIADTVNVILAYAKKNSFELIVMGTRGLSSLKGLIFGSLAHTVLNKSAIPVLLIKKLPQTFIESYLSGTV
ncbi:MAG: universal stress protein [Desulfosporosinus sp.]|nr:universal stress protein [Desulfosporosinus sp.]